MADQELSIITPSIASSASITTIGKSWGAVGATGAASFELPLPLSAGRGWDPQLTLTYSSQAGNGPFGIGWSLGIGQISRSTQKGVPRYSDLDEIIGDDGEVWHPELNSDGTPKSRVEDSYNAIPVGAHNVVRFWPRVESDFTLRERWQPVTAQGEPEEPPFWLIHGADGSLHVYGKTRTSRRADPDDALRVGSWLLCESMNPLGEHICFAYLADDQDLDPIHDYRAQRYLHAVFYGNVTASQHLYSWTVDDPAELDWHFHLLLDYGERTRSLTEAPVYAGDSLAVWDKRQDPFSTFGQGFELSTRRLCRQILMFHNFSRPADEDPLLVRRLLLEYPQAAVVPEALYQKALVELRIKDFRAAALSLDELLSRYVKSERYAEAAFWRGSLASQDENLQRAEQLLKTAVERKLPESIDREARLQLGIVLFKLGREEEAAACFQPLLNLEMQQKIDPERLIWLAEFQLSRKNPQAALMAAQVLLDKWPGDVRKQTAHALRAKVFEQQGDFVKAAVEYRTALSINVRGSYAADAAYALAEILFKEHKYGEAEGYYKTTADFTPASEQVSLRARAYAGLMRTAVLLKKDEDAVRYAMTLAILFDDAELVPEALDTAAEIFIRTGRRQEAQGVINELLQRYPRSVRAAKRK